MKRIILIIPSLGTGGAERILINLASKLREHSIVEILCYRKNTIYDIDKRIHVTAIGENYFFPNSFFLLIFLLKNIKNQNTTLISFTTRMNVVCSLVGKIKGLRIIVSERNNLEKILEYHLPLIWKYLIGLTYKLATYVVVQTDGNKSLLESMFGLNNVLVIPNFIDLTRLPPNKFRFNSFNDNITFLNVARFVRQKNQIFLIKAFERLLSKRSNLNVKLVLVGDGPLLSYCKEYVIEKKLSKWVFFTGVQKDVNKFYLHCDVFVLASLYEGFPNVMLEAMKFQLPIISANCDFGPSELLNNGEYGLLFNYEIDDLVEKLEFMLTFEHRLHFAVQSQIRVLDYSDENIVAKWFKLL